MPQSNALYGETSAQLCYRTRFLLSRIEKSDCEILSHNYAIRVLTFRLHHVLCCQLQAVSVVGRLECHLTRLISVNRVA